MDERPTALVTGAAGALAASVIAELENAGWLLALLSKGPVERLRERYPDRHTASVDLTDEGAARKVIARLEQDVGGFDAVLNLAGGFAAQPVAELRLEHLQRMLGMNLSTLMVATGAVLPGMLERGRGIIVGIAAASAVDGGARIAAYAASKAAVAAYLRSLDRELSAQNVRSLIVYPMGTLDTAANRDALPDADPSRWIATSSLASAIRHGMTVGPRARLTELAVWPDPS
jgi:NADP-dependent 3-hydroxy acid dehydrogenase YdfG